MISTLLHCTLLYKLSINSILSAELPVEINLPEKAVIHLSGICFCRPFKRNISGRMPEL
jgi:hypothetical protein